MATHDMVYQIFIVYIFLKALFFAPLLWFAFCVKMKERRESSLSHNANLSAQAEAQYSSTLIEQAG